MGLTLDGNIYFTSEDVVAINNYLSSTNKPTFIGMVEYMNKRLQCSKVAKVLQQLIDEGIKVMPKLIYRPETLKVRVENGVFKLDKLPYKMSDSYFIWDIIYVKYDSTGTVKMFTDIEFNPATLEGKIINDIDPNDNITGTGTITFFVLTEVDDAS